MVEGTAEVNNKVVADIVVVAATVDSQYSAVDLAAVKDNTSAVAVEANQIRTDRQLVVDNTT